MAANKSLNFSAIPEESTTDSGPVMGRSTDNISRIQANDESRSNQQNRKNNDTDEGGTVTNRPCRFTIWNEVTIVHYRLLSCLDYQIDLKPIKIILN